MQLAKRWSAMPYRTGRILRPVRPTLFGISETQNLQENGPHSSALVRLISWSLPRTVALDANPGGSANLAPKRSVSPAPHRIKLSISEKDAAIFLFAMKRDRNQPIGNTETSQPKASCLPPNLILIFRLNRSCGEPGAKRSARPIPPQATKGPKARGQKPPRC